MGNINETLNGEDEVLPELCDAVFSGDIHRVENILREEDTGI